MPKLGRNIPLYDHQSGTHFLEIRYPKVGQSFLNIILLSLKTVQDLTLSFSNNSGTEYAISGKLFPTHLRKDRFF